MYNISLLPVFVLLFLVNKYFHISFSFFIEINKGDNYLVYCFPVICNKPAWTFYHTINFV